MMGQNQDTLAVEPLSSPPSPAQTCARPLAPVVAVRWETPTDEQSSPKSLDLEILLSFTSSIVRNTWSGDVISLALMQAQSDCEAKGMDPAHVGEMLERLLRGIRAQRKGSVNDAMGGEV